MFDVISKTISSRINNLHQSLYPLYICFNLIGLSNYKLHKIRRQYVIDKIGVARALIQFSIYYYVVLKSNVAAIRSLDSSTGLIDFVSVCSTTIANIIIIVNSILGIVFTGKITTILNRIEEIDREFKKNGLKIKHW